MGHFVERRRQENQAHNCDDCQGLDELALKSRDDGLCMLSMGDKLVGISCSRTDDEET